MDGRDDAAQVRYSRFTPSCALSKTESMCNQVGVSHHFIAPTIISSLILSLICPQWLDNMEEEFCYMETCWKPVEVNATVMDVVFYGGSLNL